MTDAALGFFRSSESNEDDANLFSTVRDFISIEKGWFSPYLFASHRRPIIPRTVQPDVVFCHGPFVAGDYRIAQTLLEQSATMIALCDAPVPETKPEKDRGVFSDLFHRGKTPDPSTKPEASAESNNSSPNRTSSLQQVSGKGMDDKTPNLTDWATQARGSVQDFFNRSKTHTIEPVAKGSAGSEEAVPANVLAEPPLRRMVVVVLGLKPHRVGLWASSERPEESVMYYLLLNGCPSLVLPLLPGSPLVAWHALTLEQLQKLEGGVGGARFKAVADKLVEYVSLCIDWDRVVPDSQVESTANGTARVDLDENRRSAVRRAVESLLTGAVQSDCKELRNKLDRDRAGIVFFRVP